MTWCWLGLVGLSVIASVFVGGVFTWLGYLTSATVSFRVLLRFSLISLDVLFSWQRLVR